MHMIRVRRAIYRENRAYQHQGIFYILREQKFAFKKKILNIKLSDTVLSEQTNPRCLGRVLSGESGGDPSTDSMGQA